MPALSKKQQKFMGIVRSIQKGEQPASKFSKDAQDVAKDMKKSSVKKFAGTKHKGLPSKVRKEYILNKLRKTIREELEDYRYGSGDIVKDVNPTCPHYGAMGKVKSVNPRSVVFVVMNKGKNFKPGMELEKSHDQMKKMNENKVYKVGDTVSLLSFDRKNRGRAKVKGVTKSRPNKFGIKNHYITNKGTFTDMEVEGTEAFKLRFKGDTEKKVTKAMNSPYGVVLPEEINEKKKMFPPKKMTPKQAKEYKKFIDYAKMGIEYQIDMSLFESVNEDGHTDVASSKRKVMIMVDDSNKLLNKLNGMNKEDSLPSWWSDKITLSQSYLSKATDFLLNPVESVNEIRNNKEAQTAMNQIGNKALYMIGAKDFVTGTSDGKKSLVFKIMRNSKGVSHIRMRLSSMDLYDMDFLAIRAGKIKIKSKEKGVYGDQLGAMIKKNTGLNIRL